MKATKENVKVGTRVSFTNKFNCVFSGVIVRISEKSVWMDNGSNWISRMSWNSLKDYNVVE